MLFAESQFHRASPVVQHAAGKVVLSSGLCQSQRRCRCLDVQSDRVPEQLVAAWALERAHPVECQRLMLPLWVSIREFDEKALEQFSYQARRRLVARPLSEL